MAQQTDVKPAVERIHPPDWLMKPVNPVMKFLLARGRPKKASRDLVILHFTGRRSGQPYDVVVRVMRREGCLVNLTSSGWRVNFRGGRDLEVTTEGERVPGHAGLEEDPDEVAAFFHDLVTEMGHEQAGRQLGVRINVDRNPTLDELREMVVASGMAVLRIDTSPADSARSDSTPTEATEEAGGSSGT